MDSFFTKCLLPALDVPVLQHPFVTLQLRKTFLGLYFQNFISLSTALTAYLNTSLKMNVTLNCGMFVKSGTLNKASSSVLLPAAALDFC